MDPLHDLESESHGVAPIHSNVHCTMTLSFTDSGKTTSTLALFGGVVCSSVHHCSRLTVHQGVISHCLYKHNFCINPSCTPKKTREDPSSLIVGSMKMGYVYPTTNNIEASSVSMCVPIPQAL